MPNCGRTLVSTRPSRTDCRFWLYPNSPMVSWGFWAPVEDCGPFPLISVFCWSRSTNWVSRLSSPQGLVHTWENSKHLSLLAKLRDLRVSDTSGKLVLPQPKCGRPVTQTRLQSAGPCPLGTVKTPALR